MRSKWRFKLFLWLTVALFLPSSFAQDYTRWGLPKGAKMRIGKGEITSNISYSPDGTRIAIASNAGIWIYDAGTGDELNLLTGHTARVGSVAFSPDGATLASGGRTRDDPTIRLWDAHTGEHKRTLESKGNYVTSLAFSPDGSTLASGTSGGASLEKTISLWDVSTGEHLRTFDGHPTFSECGGVLPGRLHASQRRRS